MIRNFSLIPVIILSVIVEIIPIQLQIQNGEGIKRNSVEGSQLNECLSESDRSEVGVCFGKELLSQLNSYDETDSFSLATGVSFVRDEQLPRDIGSFLDKDPMDLRSIMEDASKLISKRSLHWDLGKVYPGLVMRIGPTLANGVLEFVIDPRLKDRSFPTGSMTTGRLLIRNMLLPFLMGIKFHVATLLPLLLGLLLFASKKAFLLAKLALIAVTVFTGFGTGQNYFQGFFNPGTSSPHFSAYNGYHHHYDYHNPGGGYYRDEKHYHYPGEYDQDDHPYYYDKSNKPEPISPITPDELRDRLERLFITKQEKIPREESKMTSTKNFNWTPISGR